MKAPGAFETSATTFPTTQLNIPQESNFITHMIRVHIIMVLFNIINENMSTRWPGITAQSVLRLATGWTTWESNPAGGEDLRTCRLRALEY